MAISKEDFLIRVEEIAAEEPAYEKGKSGDNGTCDCIGLIIGAIRRAGGQWRGLHGSNYAARSEVKKLEPITGTADLEIGEAVFKAYEPGTGGYDLPARYEPGGSSYNGDIRDYYHVGVVVSVNPLRIRHMTTPRPKTDTSLNKWTWHGWLKKISKTGEVVKPMGKAIVFGGNTEAPIRIRASASRASAIVAEIPQGTEVELIESSGAWGLVEWSGKKGYVMSEFIHVDGIDTEKITVSKEELEKAYDILGDLLGLRG